MMATKVTTQLMLVLVFTLFATKLAWGDLNCFTDKHLLVEHCNKSLKPDGRYVTPDNNCCYRVKYSDMVCVCDILNHNDTRISPSKFIRLARDCGKPLPLGTICGGKY